VDVLSVFYLLHYQPLRHGLAVLLGVIVLLPPSTEFAANPTGSGYLFGIAHLL
jgi:hypothetical protein